MIQLTPFYKLVVVAVAVGVTLFVTIITICLVCPYCWLFKKLHPKKNENEAVKAGPITINLPQYPGDYKPAIIRGDPPPPYEATVPSSSLEMIYLSPSTNTGRRFSRLTVNSNGDSLSRKEIGRGTVTLELELSKIKEAKNFCEMTITLKEAHGLLLQPNVKHCEIYFTLDMLVKGSFSRSREYYTEGDISSCNFQTLSVRKCPSPMYNESFSCHITESSLRKYILKVTAWENDRLTNDTALGEGLIAFKELPREFKHEHKGQVITLQLREPKTNNGEILLGLCHLPTAEKITVAILKIQNLRRMKKSQPGVEIYVQVIGVYNGKITEKRNTSSHPYSTPSIFNEMLMLDIPSSKLVDMLLIVAVRTCIPTVDHHVLLEQDKDSGKTPCIGKMMIGLQCSKTELDHWNTMKDSPRKQIVQWHQLK